MSTNSNLSPAGRQLQSPDMSEDVQKLRMAIRAEQLRWAMQQSITLTELEHTQLQLRLVSALLAGALIFDLVDPAVLLLAGEGRSVLERVAATSTLHTVGCGLVFATLAALLGPFLTLQIGGCFQCHRRPVVKLTCAVLAVAGVLWCFLAWQSVPLQLGAAVPWLMARNGAGAMLFSLALALSLNAELLRTMEHPSC